MLRRVVGSAREVVLDAALSVRSRTGTEGERIKRVEGTRVYMVVELELLVWLWRARWLLIR